MSLKIDDNNYQTYKQVLEIIHRHLYKDFEHLFSADTHPITVLTSWESSLPKSKLRQGLRQAIADMLTDINDYPKKVADINVELASNNLPSVQTLQGLIFDSVKKVIKRQKIKNIDEYYIIKELIDNTVSDITGDERRQLSKMLGDFEQKDA